MFFWLKKREYKEVDEKISKISSSIERSFLNVKTDITHVLAKIDGLRSDHKSRYEEMVRINKRINELEIVFKEIYGLRYDNFKVFGQPFGHKQTDVRFKQLSVGVQTPKKSDEWTKKLTPMERVIINTLLNSDMKYSYEDLSVLLGRDKSTIRGQMNSIKQKNEVLVNEHNEMNGKKRFYISEDTKNRILKERNMAIKGLVSKK